jgi:hypothetical protein
MAEATDRPAGSGEEAGLGTMPGLSPPEVYRPLSLLALAGFGLAVLYAAVVGFSAVVALFNRQPLLLPLFLFLVPAVAFVLSWTARNRIRSSEGTRSGLGFTSWGIGLSLVCGLLYGAYYAATYFAVRQQASTLADQYFDLIRKDDLPRAFRLGVEPWRRPADDAGLRDALEFEFNSPRKDRVSWSGFRQSEFVELLQGQEVQVQPLGVTQWDYDKGGYFVHLRYRLRTPEVIGDALLVLFGSEAPAGEYEGRQWQVLTNNSGFIRETMRATPRGEHRLEVTQAARKDADEWSHNLMTDPSRTWLVALPATQREAAVRAFSRCGAFSFPTLAGAAVLGAARPADADLVVTRHAFEAGALVHDDKQTFRALERKRDDIARTVRLLFAPMPQRRRGRITLAQSVWFPWEEKDGVVRVSLEGQFMVLDEGLTTPQYNVDARLLMEATAAADKAPSDWRLRSVELISGHSAPQGLPGGLEPPPPGGAANPPRPPVQRPPAGVPAGVPVPPGG